MTPTPRPPATDQNLLIDSYEQLRKLAISGRIQGVRDGLCVLLQKGMAAWMEVYSSCRIAISKTKDNSPKLSLPGEQHNAVVELIAGMALNQLKEIGI